MINRDCASCPFFDLQDEQGRGRCKLRDESMRSSNECAFMMSKPMSTRQIIKVLHEHQRWRRGGKQKMIPPFLLGDAIDNAIRILRSL